MNLDFLLYLVPIIIVAAVIKAATSEKKSEYSYKLQPYLLTKAELNFYLNLCKQMPREYGISSKVRLADVLKPREQGKRYKAALAKVWAKHLDFVIYELRTGKIISAIELDDRSHEKASRRARDTFLNLAAEDAGLKLHRVPNKSGWSKEDIAPLIPGYQPEPAAAPETAATT
ncbi:DUF2726 domain-containing protein [Microbulbifer sp. DLAB2-AF]|uniref:DUF2726 domain-containing protein n=1 Tax=Microbulbifer sp. DLAB2-AF TaxID=3243395 RepID=UPI0040395495